MRIKLTQKTSNCIFGQYKGIYLDEKEHELLVSNGEGSESTIKLLLNQGSEVTVDFMKLSLANGVLLDEVIETDRFILTSFAKNPKMGIVVIITGAPYVQST